MIGMNLLTKMHHRLIQAKAQLHPPTVRREPFGSSQLDNIPAPSLNDGVQEVEPFPGITLYLFGDLRQLPPVLDTAIYSAPRAGITFTALAPWLISGFQKKVALTVYHRQNADQALFKDLLDSLAIRKVTPKQ